MFIPLKGMASKLRIMFSESILLLLKNGSWDIFENTTGRAKNFLNKELEKYKREISASDDDRLDSSFSLNKS